MREKGQTSAQRIFPELPAILGCDLGVCRFLFLVFVGKLNVESIPTDRYSESSDAGGKSLGRVAQLFLKNGS
jgi:hypothetical protein